MARNVKKSLSNCCKNEGFQPGLLELQDKNIGNHVILDVCNGTFTCKDEQANTTDVSARIHSTLHVEGQLKWRKFFS